VDENPAAAVQCDDEATVFTGWIYDHLQPHAAALKVAHPQMLRAELKSICREGRLIITRNVESFVDHAQVNPRKPTTFESIILNAAVIESGAPGLANTEETLALLIFSSSKMADC
jgi:hypothetical protein